MGEPKSKRMKRPAPPKPAGPPRRQVIQVGRNEPCPCGSGKKYKQCHESEGQAFLAKLTYERQRKETMQRLKDEGVPWYKRLLAVR